MIVKLFFVVAFFLGLTAPFYAGAGDSVVAKNLDSTDFNRSKALAEKNLYVGNNGLMYPDEKAYLKDMKVQRELIHPDQTQMLYWLAASLIGFLGIYGLCRKFLK
jgi:hypothetical protein